MNRIDVQLKDRIQSPYLLVDDDELASTIQQLESNEGFTVRSGQYQEKTLEVHIRNGEVQSFIVERDVVIERNTDD